MRKILLTGVSGLLMLLPCYSQNNLALKLDGKDSNVRIGMDITQPSWTIEAWIKGDDTQWKTSEVIIGGGEYSQIDIVDNMPLSLKNGRLYNAKTQLLSNQTLDGNWHHVALSCDGRQTSMYLDGQLQGTAMEAHPMIAGAIGVSEESASVFGGLVDEVRIWSSALDLSTLKEWATKPVTPAHKAFCSLKGYYPFDETDSDMFVNWVAAGHLSFHLRNGRIAYSKDAPLAYTVPNDNPKFENTAKRESLFNAVTIASEWDAVAGAKDDQVIKLRLAVNGSTDAMNLSELALDLSASSNLSDIDKVHVYYTGQKAKSDTKVELFGTGTAPKAKMVFRADKSQAIQLKEGINYFLVTFDINKNAVDGNRLKATVPYFRLGKKSYTPSHDSDYCDKLISRTTENTLRVLQWNIWHGGVHLGSDGRRHVIDLIRSTGADIITMQEAYGAQTRIAKELGMNMQSKSDKDNLALFSRYPITKIETKSGFNSNPAKITLPSGRQIIVNDCWLRYAYRPEYTCAYPNQGMDPTAWIKEDEQLAQVDIQNILERDTDPYKSSADMPVIIGGDFNSCSHLDWTARTKGLHFGYGEVKFPVSQFMIDRGYKDTFRQINPDELKNQGGTFAVIYGQLQNARIDFLYYTEGNIKAVKSKIIRSSEEIDFVWPSDHAAVLTVFEVQAK